MRAIWTGVARSAGRTDPVTGLPTEYRMVVYDGGQGSCTCPSFLFQGLRNKSLSDDQKLRFRCKHLLQAFAAQLAPGAATGAPPVGPPSVTPSVTSPATPLPTADPDEYFDEDDEYIEPQIRR